jgi:CheY-like chemotaxis protein
MADDAELSDGLAGKQVLIVEDEFLVTMLIEDALGNLGCRVAGTAGRFDEALEKARSLAFDVAILDVNLDGKRTFPIAELLAERGRAFVFATGYGADNVPDALADAPILPKPFQQSDLEHALRQALAAAPSPDLSP